jgi:TRAP-type C4-dicarboxylate transport system substrate-binding protein
VGREIERIKQNVEKAVREKIDSYLADFEKIVESKLNEAYSKLEQYNVQINEFEKLKDAKLKEIEDEIKRRGGKLLEQFFRR